MYVGGVSEVLIAILKERDEYLDYSPPPLLERLIEDTQKSDQNDRSPIDAHDCDRPGAETKPMESASYETAVLCRISLSVVPLNYL